MLATLLTGPAERTSAEDLSAEGWPVATGTVVAQMAAYDRIFRELMQKRNVPGGAVAVAKEGRLIFARGYGLADVDANRPVKPDSLFRIASVSKPITAAAILALVEQDRLDLDAKAVDLLPSIRPPPGKKIDPQLRQVTIRQLLHHTAGFDRGKSFDPMLSPATLTDVLGSTAGQVPIIRFMLDRPLDFQPGTRYAYSNFGYCMLGRVIEQVTGQNYAEAVRDLVLKPAGIAQMRLGHTQRDALAQNEVCYYPRSDSRPVRSVFPDVEERVPSPYGRFYIEAMDAHGGWTASAIDLVRFATAVDGTRPTKVLGPATRRLIESHPAPPVSVDTPTYYGLGWMVRPKEANANWWHAGSLPGTTSLLVHTHHGMVWAAVFNFRPPGNAFPGEVDRAFWQAAGEVNDWPEHDLFDRYESPNP